MNAKRNRVEGIDAAPKVLADYSQDSRDARHSPAATVDDAPDLCDMWLRAAAEASALRYQVAHLEALWLRAEAEADYWYFAANNPAEVRAERERMLRDFDVALARTKTAEKWAELDRIAAERAEAARA